MINLLFSGNDKVFDGILTCLLSIVKRTGGGPVRAVVFTMDITRLDPAYKSISDRKIAFLDKVVKGYDPLNSVIKVDVGAQYAEELAYCPNEGAYCSPYTLLRLLADLVPETASCDKLLYLDADVMFNRDATLLYDVDVSGYEYAAARDHYGKFLLRPDYINAGVLLFNMKECLRTGLFAKARGLMRKKKYLFADQDAVFRSTTKKKLLPQRFNDQKFLHGHTVVRHFSKRLFWLPYPHTDNIKQWQVDRVRKVFRYKAFDDVFDEYLKLKEEMKSEK